MPKRGGFVPLWSADVILKEEFAEECVPGDTLCYIYGDEENKVEILPAYNSVRSIGATFAIVKTLEKTGVTAILNSVFNKKRAAQILTVIAYMTCRGNVMEHIFDWCEGFNTELGISNVTFIMDKRFCPALNIRYMHSAQLPYIIGAEVRNKATLSAIENIRSEIVSMSKRIEQGVSP